MKKMQRFKLASRVMRRSALVLAAVAVVFGGLPAARGETLSYFTDPDNTTLQGWNNRVWDDTASAWVDLAPDITTMPAEINGGVILPAAQGDENNGLFEGGRENGWLGGGRGVGPGGDGDKHANTLWLRSPLFVLDGSGDLNVTLFGGYPKGAAPTSDAAIPSAATDEGGWMGVALRRISESSPRFLRPSGSICFQLSRKCCRTTRMTWNRSLTISAFGKYFRTRCR